MKLHMNLPKRQIVWDVTLAALSAVLIAALIPAVLWPPAGVRQSYVPLAALLVGAWALILALAITLSQALSTIVLLLIVGGVHDGNDRHHLGSARPEMMPHFRRKTDHRLSRK
jgi:uncharacterized membrane protein